MILFIAEYPDNDNMREGMMQRVKFIDDIFSSIRRTYVYMLPTQHIHEKVQNYGLADYYELNSFLHRSKLIELADKADVIYIHSILNGFVAGWLYFTHSKKIITDLHGVVPEEFHAMNHRVKAYVGSYFEKFAVHRSAMLVSVTQAMTNHYITKYPVLRNRRKPLLLPLFSAFSVEKANRSIQNSLPPGFIYAGGLQSWQNIDRIMELFRFFENSESRLTLLSGDEARAKRIAHHYGLDKRICIESVPHDKISEQYFRHDFGLILRSDNVINRVALPTKLVEYLAWGLIPIVLQPNIGDFLSYDYQYVLYDDLINGSFDFGTIPKLRNHNFKIYEDFCNDCRDSLKEFKSAILDMIPN